MLSTRLKDLCNQYGVFIESSTQLNGEWKDAKIPDQNLLRGAKAIADWTNFLNKYFLINKLEKRTINDKKSYYIRCGGTNKPYQILKQLYDSCETHLNRKYLLYKNLETVVLKRNFK